MIIKQVSVFLENKAGQLARLIAFIADNNIDLEALSVNETQEYGIVRVIVDKPDELTEALRANDWLCKRNNVLEITVPDETGSMLKIFTLLADNGFDIAYTYAFYSKKQGHASIIIRLTEKERVNDASELLRANGIEC